jgi:hypothetical protein
MPEGATHAGMWLQPSTRVHIQSRSICKELFPKLSEVLAMLNLIPFDVWKT